MLRRNLLKTTAYIPVGVAVSLAGCASVSQWVDSNLGQVVADANLVNSGVKYILTQFAGVVGLDQGAVTTITGIADDINAVVQTLAGTYTESNAKPLVERLATLLTSFATVAGTFVGLPPIVGMVLQAAEVLIPAIEKVLGIAGVSARLNASINPDQARVILKTLGK
jgi:hypothetical protein